MRKIFMGLAAAAVLVAPVAMAGPANAAAGDMALNLDFENPDAQVLADVGATTAFTRSIDEQGNWGDEGKGTMYDPGTYTIGTNPREAHELWADWPDSTDRMLLVNGFTNVDQKVLEVSVPGTNCTTAGSNVSYDFSANMVNILPAGVASDGGAAISVYINNVLLGSETVLNTDPSNIIHIKGGVPATNQMVVTIVNNGTAYSGNDFAIDDITLTQVGECKPPCKDEIKGVWHNYTGNFGKAGKDVAPKDGIPDLDDPLWKVHTNTPGGQHEFSTRQVNKPYQTGKPGNGDWFYWSDEGAKCS